MAQKVLLRKFQDSYLKLWPHGIRKCSIANFEKEEKVTWYGSKSVNEVKLLGYVGQNPKKYSIIAHQFVTYFSLATDRYYLDKSDVRQRITTWHAIIVRRPHLQEYVMKYISRGTRTYISGYMDDRSFEFSGEFQLKGPVHVVADEVIFLKKSENVTSSDSPYFINVG